ncbi:class I SAM-dependent methyltransferase [Pseudorhodoplanes sp.]|jgi:SAM-dependent methyltransferase|uniref:class I SAM-dependent methyltransferase n=1 Tax=Pseudorhodoplanes sp. TaxID=1934341 RepID=UPI002CADE068|nr:class I SAM-dependent methyltransferase [Pseudorhodoplanes sp.]HWV42013.1 class I SAM-dependent methyltransferase [Pseudorhodoplanes sp.]
MTLPDFARDFATIDAFLAWWLENPVLQEPHAGVFNGYYAGYRAKFTSYVRHHYRGQSEEVCQLIAAQDRPALLEIGGGCGTEALWFALRGARVLAIDVNAERLAVARARQEIVEQGIGRRLDLEFRFCSLFDLPRQPDFDLIWMEQAFHHVEPRDRVYSTIAALLKPGGRVVISEANGWNPLLQLVLLRRRGFRTVVERTTEAGERILYGNERITVPSRMARGFAEAGITQDAVRYFRVFPNISAADRLMPIENWIPGSAAPLFSHYNFVGRKA